VEESGGIEMVAMDAGGFDEGEGDKNVSCDVDPNDLVCLSCLRIG